MHTIRIGLCVAALAVTAAGCEPSLSKGEAGKLALDYGKSHCVMTQLYANPVDMSPDWTPRKPVEIPINELLNSLARLGKFQSVSQQSVSNGMTAYRFKGPDGFGYYYEKSPDRAQGAWLQYGVVGDFRGCMFIPAEVRVLDVSIDPNNHKRATVVLTWPRQTPTYFAQIVMQSTAASQLVHQDITPASRFEFDPDRKHDAKLEYLDATGWQVTGLDDHAGG